MHQSASLVIDHAQGQDCDQLKSQTIARAMLLSALAKIEMHLNVNSQHSRIQGIAATIDLKKPTCYRQDRKHPDIDVAPGRMFR